MTPTPPKLRNDWPLCSTLGGCVAEAACPCCPPAHPPPAVPTVAAAAGRTQRDPRRHSAAVAYVAFLFLAGVRLFSSHLHMCHYRLFILSTPARPELPKILHL